MGPHGVPELSTVSGFVPRKTYTAAIVQVLSDALKGIASGKGLKFPDQELVDLFRIYDSLDSNGAAVSDRSIGDCKRQLSDLLIGPRRRLALNEGENPVYCCSKGMRYDILEV